MADQRIGVDPLANAYLKIGAIGHDMKYLAAGSEDMPFPECYFDVVCSFNSLDHVDDLNKTINEIIRIIKPGGLFLLLTDVHPKPTHCEPICFSFDIVNRFLPDLKLVEFKHFEKKGGGLYESILDNISYDHTDRTKRYEIVSAKFIKV
jgi:ubiquinone/menaquinone biosynthesis C-methylase UbiE